MFGAAVTQNSNGRIGINRISDATHVRHTRVIVGQLIPTIEHHEFRVEFVVPLIGQLDTGLREVLYEEELIALRPVRVGHFLDDFHAHEGDCLADDNLQSVADRDIDVDERLFQITIRPQVEAGGMDDRRVLTED